MDSLNIYIDVYSVMTTPVVSEIQRVVRETTRRLIQVQGRASWKLYLVRWQEEKSAFHILDNNMYLLWLEGNATDSQCLSGQMLLAEQIPANSVFFDLDSVWMNKPSRSYLYSVLKHRDVKISALIYDIVPITQPQYIQVDKNYMSFPKYTDAVLAYADLIFINSRFVENELEQLAAQMGRQRPALVVAPLGSDFTLCRKSDPKIDQKVKQIARSAPFLLTVDAVEPRKNHKVILDAFDHFLKKSGVNIIFVGQAGLGSQAVIKRIKRHPQNKKRIFHFEETNSETLSFLYQEALYTVVPTYVDGSGLPAVESLTAGTPALLSDIPVMHEAAGDYAGYFAPDDPEQLAKLVLRGLSEPDHYEEVRKKIASYRPASWDDFVENLIRGLLTLRKNVGAETQDGAQGENE